jgi:hypothetical protein
MLAVAIILELLARQAAGKCAPDARLEQTLRRVEIFSFASQLYGESCPPLYRNAWASSTRGRFSKLYEGEPQKIFAGPRDSLWVYSLWTAEAGVPHLWRSSDGLHWHEVRLPHMRVPGIVFSEQLVWPRVKFVASGRCASE